MDVHLDGGKVTGLVECRSPKLPRFLFFFFFLGLFGSFYILCYVFLKARFFLPFLFFSTFLNYFKAQIYSGILLVKNFQQKFR